MIKVFTHGREALQYKGKILSVVDDTLSKCKFAPEYLEVHIFDTLNDILAFYDKEYIESAVEMPATLDIYFAMHDAHRGWPRILICIDLIKSYPEAVWIGSIQHEVGHAILHGSLKYYVISPTEKFWSFCKSHDIDELECMNFVHQIAISVKDYETTRYLIRNGLIEDQYKFAAYFLESVPEEAKMWYPLNEFSGKLHYLLTYFKLIAAAAPILAVDRYGEEMRNKINKVLSSVDEKDRAFLKELVEYLSDLGENTIENIYYYMDLIAEIYRG